MQIDDARSRVRKSNTASGASAGQGTQSQKENLIAGLALGYTENMDTVAKRKVSIRINGVEQAREVEPRLLLVHFLRDVVGLTGTHIGCETSICGACTVMLDRAAVKSCTVLTVQCEGAQVLTIEGLANGDELHPMQAAFREHHGLQCGYCTPGMIMTAVDMVRRKGNDLDEHTIREQLDGNLCRCTGYHNIVKAIAAGAKAMAQPPLREAAE
jgi:carbon-monoxide dehydrogenase small subunit